MAVPEEKPKQKSKIKTKLMTRFRLLFLGFTFVSLSLIAITTYISKQSVYRNDYQNMMKQTVTYVYNLLNVNGADFAELQKFYMEYWDELLIDFDFDGDYTRDQDAFYAVFEKNYPDAVFHKDIGFADLDHETKLAYAKYQYEYWLTHFEQARDAFHLEYVYVIVPQDDMPDDLVVILFNGVRENPVEIDGKQYMQLGLTANVSRDIYPMMWKTWETSQLPDQLDTVKNIYGDVYTYYLPIMYNGEKVAVLAADVTILAVQEAILVEVIANMILTLLILGICVQIMQGIVRTSVINRITRLENHVRKYSETKDTALADELTAGNKIHDEINSLAEEFASMIRELTEYMNNLQTVTAERERIGAELNVATNIQASMLPQIFPAFPDISEFDIYATMTPAKEVGGDFYDFFMADKDHLAIVIADVSGKGVPAALFMVIAKTLIKNHAQNGESVEEILTNANNQLDEGNGGELFVTVWLGLYNIRTGELTFSEAGHENPLLLHANGEVEIVKPKRKRIPLASMGGIRYLSNTMQLQKGDCLFLYTDGVPEATNDANEMYGMERLNELMQKQTDLEPTALLQAVRKDVDVFVGDAPQFDDLTMLAIRVNELTPPQTAMRRQKKKSRKTIDNPIGFMVK
ncbi:MAG: PP2C family protein-serine/threonine phosphatase [Oscillospiraceae bacterium]|nr:PP2C family protein-serine/threonine phosphatase [Oscillospiraceae bacterium]